MTSPVGRKTKYTPETVKTLLDIIRTGGTDSDAYTIAGIHADTFYAWMGKSEFSEQILKARSEGKVARIARITKAGQGGTWQADAWYLERRFPEEYAQSMIIKVTGEQSAILKRVGLTPAQAFEMMVQELATVSDASSD